MTEPFDPYWQWLEIPADERPIDYYRLLDIPRFESDVSKIESAAHQRMRLVRTFQLGPHRQHCQVLLNLLARAKNCLTTHHLKARYDQELRRVFRQSG